MLRIVGIILQGICHPGAATQGLNGMVNSSFALAADGPLSFQKSLLIDTKQNG